jgi:enolase
VITLTPSVDVVRWIVCCEQAGLPAIISKRIGNNEDGRRCHLNVAVEKII